LYLKGDEPIDGGVYRFPDRAFTLIRGNGGGDPPEDAEEVGAGPASWISHGDRGGCEAAVLAKPWAAEDLVHEPDHGADNLGRRVVGAGLFPEVVVVLFQEVLVEVEPGFGIVLGDLGQ